MKGIRYVAFFLFLVIILYLASCKENESADDNEGYSYTFTDSTGATVTLNKKPSRVAVLFSSYADIWTLAGGNITVTVGDSIERGFADTGTALVDSGSGHKTIDTEALIAADVDFVIGTADYAAQVSACEFMRSLGVPSALFKVESFSDYLSMLKICTDITERRDLYVKNGVNVKERIDTIMACVSGNSEAPSVLFLRAGSTFAKAKPSKDNFAASMISELGAKNIADTVPSMLDGLSLEAVIEADPDYIFISVMGDEAAAKSYISELFENDAWQAVSAVKNKKYFILPKELFHYKPNSSWDRAYEYLALCLYPYIVI